MTTAQDPRPDDPLRGFPDPYGVLERQRQRMAGVRERAAKAQSELAENRVSVRSSDGVVEVTVNAGGQLAGLQLGAKAQSRTPVQLTELIMKTYGEACARAAARTLDIVADISGEDSISVRSMRESLPAAIAESVDEIRRDEGRGV